MPGLLEINQPRNFQYLSKQWTKPLSAVDWYENPQWSQDGRFLAALSGKAILIASFEDGIISQFKPILIATSLSYPSFGWVPESFSQTIIWTDNTNPAETELPGTSAPCANSPTPRLEVGGKARVKVDNDTPSALRSEAGTSAKAIGYLQPGTTMMVKDGPNCQDGYFWWYVLADTNQTGWVAEGGAEYWLEPISE